MLKDTTLITDEKRKELEETDKHQEEYLYTYPRSFDKKDPERIKIFSKRLKEIREKRMTQPETDTTGARRKWTQEAIGKELGIGAAGYAKYEKGKLMSVPMKNIITLCDVFNVTPHYLLGYAQDEYSVVELDKNQDIVIGENGKPIELKTPFVFFAKIQRDAVIKYSELITKEPYLFNLIRKLMVAPENKKSVCITVLSALLEKL